MRIIFRYKIMILWIWIVPNQLASLPPLNLINPHNSLILLLNIMLWFFTEGEMESRGSSRLLTHCLKAGHPSQSLFFTITKAYCSLSNLGSWEGDNADGHYIKGKGQARSYFDCTELLLLLSPKHITLEKLDHRWRIWDPQVSDISAW